MICSIRIVHKAYLLETVRLVSFDRAPVVANKVLLKTSSYLIAGRVNIKTLLEIYVRILSKCSSHILLSSLGIGPRSVASIMIAKVDLADLFKLLLALGAHLLLLILDCLDGATFLTLVLPSK